MPAMKKQTTHEDVGSIFTRLVDEVPSPIGFELPDWLNKSNSTYILIQRNIYLTKKIKRRLEDDGIFCSCSTAMESSGVCGTDCHCGMLLSGCSSGCKCGSSCINKPFQLRPVKKMKIVKTEKCGSGIVADEDIKQGEFVIEYVGEVIDDKICEDRLWKMKNRGETKFYLCEINRDMVIDATFKGNQSRYINHSCCPNTEMQKWRIDGETRIGIFATRDIMKGENMTYDYQFIQYGADQDCHCGAAGCRKKLGVKPSKPRMPSSDAALKIVACQIGVTSRSVKATLKNVYQNGVLHVGLRDDANQKSRCSHDCIGEIVRIIRMDCGMFGIVKRFDSNTGRHTIMFEDGSSEFLDMAQEDWEFCKI